MADALPSGFAALSILLLGTAGVAVLQIDLVAHAPGDVEVVAGNGTVDPLLRLLAFLVGPETARGVLERRPHLHARRLDPAEGVPVEAESRDVANRDPADRDGRAQVEVCRERNVGAPRLELRSADSSGCAVPPTGTVAR